MLVPMVLLYRHRQGEPGPPVCLRGHVVFGFVANRLNVSITGMEAGSGTHYVPRWTEVAVTLSIVALGFAIFRVVAHYFPVFEEEHEPARVVSPRFRMERSRRGRVQQLEYGS